MQEVWQSSILAEIRTDYMSTALQSYQIDTNLD